MKPVLALRSLIFYCGYIPIVGVFPILGFTVGLLLPYKLRQDLLTTANALVVLWLRITCGIRFDVTGLENIPDQPFVAVSKHQSSWETYFLQRSLRPVSTVLKKELLKIPFFGWGLTMTRPIAIDRSNPRKALRDVLEQGKKRLAEGNNILLYPEGTRTQYGDIGRYGRSGAALAIAAHVPLLPIAHNAGAFWPAHKFSKRPGTIHVVIGKPLFTEQMDSKQLTEQVQAWIESTVTALPD